MNEPTQETIWHQIDSAPYLYLHRLFEPRDNQLIIILQEAGSNQARKGRRELPGGIVIEDAAPIEPTGRVFTLTWKSYVSYCVTEEMHGSCGKYEDEEYTGRLFRVYSESHYLNFVAVDTGAHFEPYRHYKIACLNHVIDIVSAATPELHSDSPEGAGLSDSARIH
jgi:hypothetical protein